MVNVYESLITMELRAQCHISNHYCPVSGDVASDLGLTENPRGNLAQPLQPSDSKGITGCDQIRSHRASHQKLHLSDIFRNKSRVFNGFGLWQSNCSPSTWRAKPKTTENKRLSTLGGSASHRMTVNRALTAKAEGHPPATIRPYVWKATCSPSTSRAIASQTKQST